MQGFGAAELLLILVIVLVLGFIVIVPYWMIFRKAGYSPWLSLLMMLPLVNIVMLYFLGFSDWPSLKQKMPLS